MMLRKEFYKRRITIYQSEETYPKICQLFVINCYKRIFKFKKDISCLSFLDGLVMYDEC